MTLQSAADRGDLRRLRRGRFGPFAAVRRIGEDLTRRGVDPMLDSVKLNAEKGQQV